VPAVVKKKNISDQDRIDYFGLLPAEWTHYRANIESSIRKARALNGPASGLILGCGYGTPGGRTAARRRMQACGHPRRPESSPVFRSAARVVRIEMLEPAAARWTA
jgi:hypothetical protein